MAIRNSITACESEMNDKAPGEKAFAVFAYAITVVKVSVVVMGISIVVTALSGVEYVLLDEHEVFRYRMHATVATIVACLFISHLLARRRARRAVDAASTVSPASRPNDYLAIFMALTFVAGGAAAFWHDHINHEIPNPVAVAGKFVSATCVARTTRVRRIVSVGPHMSIGYEFPSQSTRPRDSGMQCLLDQCEPEKTPPQQLDIEYRRVFYETLQQCEAALPDVLELKAPATVWTGDKSPNASVRARFTPERDPPPYFLLWIPSVMAAVALLVFFGFRRMRALRRAH